MQCLSLVLHFYDNARMIWKFAVDSRQNSRLRGYLRVNVFYKELIITASSALNGIENEVTEKQQEDGRSGWWTLITRDELRKTTG